MSAVSSSFKRTANNPRRFDKPWRLNDRIWKHCKQQARWLVSKICVNLVWWPKKYYRIFLIKRRGRLFKTRPRRPGVHLSNAFFSLPFFNISTGSLLNREPNFNKNGKNLSEPSKLFVKKNTTDRNRDRTLLNRYVSPWNTEEVYR